MAPSGWFRVVLIASALSGCTDKGKPEGDTCTCGILQLEDRGPAKGTCSFVEADNGDATLRSLTGAPSFSATFSKEKPPASKGKVWTAYTAQFEVDCEEPWCKGTKTDVPILRVEHLGGYRATVVRSPEGPPDQVLHLSCPSKK